MIHPESEILLALFDGELSDIETARLDRHIENCVECRERMAGLEETSAALAGVIAGLDAAEPEHWPTERPAAPDGVLPFGRRSLRHAADGTARTASGDTALDGGSGGESTPDARSGLVPLGPKFEPAPGMTGPPRRSSSTAPLRWAAGILLLLGAGATAAILARPWAGEPAAESSPALQTAPSGAAQPNVLNVTPLAGSLDVSLTGVAGPTRIEVAFADQGDVTIEATGPDRLHVQNPRGSVTLDLGATPATLRITFPSSRASGTIRVDGRTIARVSDGRLDRIGQVEGVTLSVEAADRS